MGYEDARRATVERIRARLHDGPVGGYPDDDITASGMDQIDAVLDEAEA